MLEASTDRAAFYSTFLDTQLVFSAADFGDPEQSLDDAQAAGLERVCRVLELRPGQRFLDLGCGWGGLALYAAEAYGVTAKGCGVDAGQIEYCRQAAARSSAGDRISFVLSDYRDLDGEFDRISAIGVIEHLGPRALPQFFRHVNWLLADAGLFLCQGIVRAGRPTVPGGIAAAALATAADVVWACESAGLRIQDSRDLRLNYARTCRAWTARLVENRRACLEVVDVAEYESWMQHLRATAINFDAGALGAVEMLCRREG